MLLGNLLKLDETQDEDRQGVFNTLGIIENISEARPDISDKVMSNTTFLQWALKR